MTSARAAYLHAARLHDAGRPFTKEAAVAKLVCTDNAMRVTTDAVQVLGGAGYTQDFPLERYMREAKVTQIFEGTNQIQRLVISRQLSLDQKAETPCRSPTPPSPSSPAEPPASAARPSAACTPTAPRSSSSTCPSSPGEALAEELGDRARFVADRRPRRGAGPGRDRRRPRARHAPDRRQLRRRRHTRSRGRQARPAAPRAVRQRHQHQPDRHLQRAAARRRRDARERARRRRPRRHRHDRVDRRLRRPDRTGRVCREQGWRRRPHPERRSRPGGQGDPRHDGRARHVQTPMLAGLPAEAKASSRRRCRTPRGSATPTSMPASCATSSTTRMLNGEVIRLDGALRMPPR